MMDRSTKRILGALALLTALGLGIGMASDRPDRGSTTSSRGDASARLACDHFRQVAADYRDGVLTGDELRIKLQEVHDNARVSDVPGIASNGREMLAGATSGSVPDSAVRGFGDACRSIGR